MKNTFLLITFHGNHIGKKKLSASFKKKEKGRKDVTNLVWPHKRITYDTL
jgi:hypothetical protein